jgi:Ser/Thr protein kinase RdoA (MazF antagonist)
MKIPTEIIQRWQKQFTVFDYSYISSGLSDSPVWRLSTSFGEICMKAWPESRYSMQRLEYIAACLQHARSNEMEWIPFEYKTDNGEPFLRASGYYWQACQWMRGSPDVSGQVSFPRRHSAAHTLARMHHCWSRIGSNVAQSPGIQDRLTLLEKANRDWSMLARLAESASSDFGDLANKTLAHHRRSSQRLIAKCQQILRPTMIHFVIRDIHCEHVLYDNDRVTGVIDFGAARVDEPLLDLVRLFSSQSPTDRTARYETLQIYIEKKDELYRGESTVSDFSLSFLDAKKTIEEFALIDEISTLLSAFQWVQWILLENRSFSCPRKTIIDRLSSLVHRLDLGQW